jgi:hypothetical protein
MLSSLWLPLAVVSGKVGSWVDKCSFPLGVEESPGCLLGLLWWGIWGDWGTLLQPDEDGNLGSLLG